MQFSEGERIIFRRITNNHPSVPNLHSPLDLRKSTAVFTLALLLLAQLFVAAHAVEYGNRPHEHGGVFCLAILSDEQENLPPSEQLTAGHLALDESVAPSCDTQLLFPKRPAIKPPPTGPPSSG